MKKVISPKILSLITLFLVVSGAWGQHDKEGMHEGKKTHEEKKGHAKKTQKLVGKLSNDPQFAAVDSVLKEAQVHMGDEKLARKRIDALHAMITHYPHYPLRAQLYYFLGLNAQILEDYHEAQDAFESALETDPSLKHTTPISAYLAKARRHNLVLFINIVLIVILLAALIPALANLISRNDIALPWGKISMAYALALLLWISIIFVLPMVYAPSPDGLDSYPKPRLLNFSLGHIGDGPLEALLLYGCIAIVSTLPLVIAPGLIRAGKRGVVLKVCGICMVLGSVMGLYGVRYLYTDSRFDGKHRRFVFLVKSIDTMLDVPEEMMPLYEKSFADRIRAAKKKAGK